MRNIINVIVLLFVCLGVGKCVTPKVNGNGYSQKYKLISEGSIKISGGCITYMETLIKLNPKGENVLVSVKGSNLHFPDSRLIGLDSFDVSIPEGIVSSLFYSLDSSFENPEKAVTFSTRALKVEISLKSEGIDMDTTLLEDCQDYNINVAYTILAEFLSKCVDYLER